MTHDQNGNPIHRDIRQSSIDGLWYTTVWSGSHYVTNVRRYGYRTRAEARDGDISDFDAASYHEPTAVTAGWTSRFEVGA
jgi:nucleoside diphosphate kinase